MFLYTQKTTYDMLIGLVAAGSCIRNKSPSTCSGPRSRHPCQGKSDRGLLQVDGDGAPHHGQLRRLPAQRVEHLHTVLLGKVAAAGTDNLRMAARDGCNHRTGEQQNDEPNQSAD